MLPKEFPMQYLFRPLAKIKQNKYKIDKLLIKKCNKMLLNFNSEAVSVSKPQNLVQWVCVYIYIGYQLKLADSSIGGIHSFDTKICADIQNTRLRDRVISLIKGCLQERIIFTSFTETFCYRMGIVSCHGPESAQLSSTHAQRGEDRTY